MHSPSIHTGPSPHTMSAASHSNPSVAVTTSSTPVPTASPDILIGVLALQGAFLEHLAALRRLSIPANEVRTIADLARCDGLIIPGGESTAIALLAQREGLLQPLRSFSAGRRPIFGTCAGLILLSESVLGQKRGGQELIGGLHVTTQRNHYGTQLGSFRAPLTVDAFSTNGGPQSEAVFIRAPGIVEVGADVEVLASIPKEADALLEQKGKRADEHAESTAPSDPPKQPPTTAGGSGRVDYRGAEQSVVPVAVRQGNLLATTFHPELTKEWRWHALFADMVRADKQRRMKETDVSEHKSGVQS